MAKKEQEQVKPQQTMEDYLLSQLDQRVKLKDGTMMKDPIDGHELTKQEAIAAGIINQALQGDIKAAQYIQQLQTRAQMQKLKK